jgi:hypothetical protein
MVTAMEKNVLERTAALIAQGNVTPQVAYVRVDWDGGMAKLTVQYFVDGSINDDERELCELTLTELVAEFPEICAADTQCLPFSQAGSSTAHGIVYRRGTNP